MFLLYLVESRIRVRGSWGDCIRSSFHRTMAKRGRPPGSKSKAGPKPKRKRRTKAEMAAAKAAAAAAAAAAAKGQPLPGVEGGSSGADAKNGSATKTKKTRTYERGGLILSKGVVRRIVKLDQDVRMVSLDAIYLIAKAAEAFVSQLARDSSKFSKRRVQDSLQHMQSLNYSGMLVDTEGEEIAQQAKSSTVWLRYDDIYNAIEESKRQGRDLSFLEKVIVRPPFDLIDED